MWHRRRRQWEPSVSTLPSGFDESPRPSLAGECCSSQCRSHSRESRPLVRSSRIPIGLNISWRRARANEVDKIPRQIHIISALKSHRRPTSHYV